MRNVRSNMWVIAHLENATLHHHFHSLNGHTSHLVDVLFELLRRCLCHQSDGVCLSSMFDGYVEARHREIVALRSRFLWQDLQKAGLCEDRTVGRRVRDQCSYVERISHMAKRW